MVFLDESFAWQNYLSLFPKDWEMVVDVNFPKQLEDFFG